MTDGETCLRLERIPVYCFQKGPAFEGLFHDCIGGSSP